MESTAKRRETETAQHRNAIKKLKQLKFPLMSRHNKRKKKAYKEEGEKEDN